MNKLFFRLTLGLLIAGPMILLSVAMADADPAILVIQAQDTECQICHQEFQAAWEMGSHASATSNEVFNEAWVVQGSPVECMSCHATGYDEAAGTWVDEEITCKACHSSATENHPLEPMTVDRSPQFCGDCHTETFFDWQASAHRSNELACVSCHDPHANELKTGDSSSLCATCHGPRASTFEHSIHSQVGITCADCHLGALEGDAGNGSAMRDHSFNVGLSTCNTCHVYQMHASEADLSQTSEPIPTDAMASVEAAVVTVDPVPVSPIGFATLAGLVGMASGMILAPWLERWYNRMQDEDE